MSSNFNCSYMAMSSLTYILGYIFSSETAEPNYTKAGRNGPWVGPFQNCVRPSRPPFKMDAITKNRNFFNCPLLLYYKSKWAQVITAATWQ